MSQTLLLNTIKNNLFVKLNYPSFMCLKIFLDTNDDALKQEYYKAINKNNQKLVDLDSNGGIDAGFDLFYAGQNKELCVLSQPCKINFKVKCEASMVYANNVSIPTGFYMYPRSSLSKTPLRLANSVGIIDSSYRGDLIGMFDVVPHTSLILKPLETMFYDTYHFYIEPYQRLVQICSPGLLPIYIEFVDSLNELSTTERGEGGFGSTGK